MLDMNTVAKRIGCSKGHVSKLINGKVKGAPRLPCVPVGRRKFVIESTLEEYLKDLETKGGANGQEAAAPERFPQKTPIRRRSHVVAPPVAQAR
jgi:hypothetical protein